jgi:hypothetical protein
MRELLKKLNEELESEESQNQSADEKRLHEAAQRLLRLERDLKVPGACPSPDARIERLLAEITKASF